MSVVESVGRFRPCLGKTACVDDGDRCRTCGRSLQEVARTRELIEAIAACALDLDYENYAEFADYVARKATAKIRHQREASTADVQ